MAVTAPTATRARPAQAHPRPISGFFKANSGVPSQGVNGPTTNICHSPSSSATPNTMKANQKCASTSRLLFNTGQPPLVGGHLEERGLVDHLELGPHSLMADAAEFLTGHQMLAGRVEFCGQHRDVAGHQHRIDIGLFDKEAGADVTAGGPEVEG